MEDEKIQNALAILQERLDTYDLSKYNLTMLKNIEDGSACSDKCTCNNCILCRDICPARLFNIWGELYKKDKSHYIHKVLEVISNHNQHDLLRLLED